MGPLKIKKRSKNGLNALSISLRTTGLYFILIVDSCGGKFANGILNVTTRSHSNINKKFITRLSIPN